MATYVFLTSEFPPRADANGMCIYNLCKALIEKGNNVYCICEGKKNVKRILDNINIYEVEPTLFKACRNKANITGKKIDYMIVFLVKILRRLFKAFTFITFPNVSPSRTVKMYKTLEKINSNTPIDFVVGAFRPYECIGSIVKFKKKHPNITCVPVYLDLIRPRNPFGNLFLPLFLKLCYINEKKVFSISDRIMLPKGSEKTYLSSKFEFAKDKIAFFDFPVFTDDLIETTGAHISNNDVINITSIGTIDGKNRNTAYFLEIIETIIKNHNKKIHVHFLGRFSDIKVTEKYKNSNFVSFYGNVSPQKVAQFIASSNYLVNFGNKLTYDMVPSKIFQYFASCKPIINMVAHKYDNSLKYFSKYPNSCNILEYNTDRIQDTEKLFLYISDADLKYPDYKDIEEIFKSSKPEFFVEEFLK